MQLSEHFTLEEFVASSKAAELGIDNTPNAEIVANLTTTAQGFEQARSILGGVACHVTSGYRCTALNKAVGGVWNSAHLDGFAGDFKAPDFGTPLQIVEALAKAGLRCDQCIMEGNWVHLSFAPAMRCQILTATFDAHNEATYTNGVA